MPTKWLDHRRLRSGTRNYDLLQVNYSETQDILEQHEIPFHTYNESESKEMSVIFGGIAQDILGNEKAEELKQSKGSHGI
ncbi:hypothetical protein JTB14_024708 [Gonioctena quinquepunctata]|nr:hypothetical protein JTB14_024708 [Gonioctena quinquepunctata]